MRRQQEEDELARLRANDPSAQRSMYERLAPRLRRLCQHVLGDAAWAEETAEDIWMDFLLHHAGNVNSPAALDAYLRMMTLRRCVRLRDWRGRHLEADEQAMGAVDPEPDLIAAIDRARDLRRLEECLGQLSRRSRRVLRLRFHSSLTQPAIGERLGVTKQYVGRIIQKSIEALRRCMETAA